MMKKCSLILFSVLYGLNIMLSQQQLKTVEAFRTAEKIHIDGELNETSWEQKSKAVDFLELNPTEGKQARFPTEVTILYDNYAIYIGAFCYDSSPDSILRQLGERDDDLNADLFTVSFDTYNKKLDAFVFSVAASGVQSDYKFSDESFNAVWKSHVRVNEKGWVVEMEIPFSSLRFPNSDSLEWNVQFAREIRRFRSQLQWSLVSKNFTNEINYWGKLKGLNHIKNPIRLQFSPYLSGSFSEKAGVSNYTYGGGADMKFGLSEGFTLDMTLLPDFSQVLSDNQVKNLTAFEVVYQERRPFFQEGVDLFNQGNLFYSRRIGGKPLGYSKPYYQLDSNEVVASNPSTSKLLNVTKISGRTKKGTGIGFLNALTNETFATIQDTLNGRERQLMTNPLTNYSILSIDQNLRNNSSVYLINLNTYRASGYYDANVTSMGANLVNKKNSYLLAGNIKISQQEDTLTATKAFKKNDNDGSDYAAQFSKIKGKFRFTLSTENISPKYNPNDLGVNFKTNYRFHRSVMKYNRYNPFWILNQWYNTVSFQLEQNYTTNQLLRKQLSYNTFTTLRKSFHSFFMNFDSQLGDAIDLFEARIPGKIFIQPGYAYGSVGISSDYRRKLAIDGTIGVGYGSAHYGQSLYHNFSFAPIIRLTDKLTLRPSVDYVNQRGGVGFGGYDSIGNPVYGRRKIVTLTNIISLKYLFKNNLSLSLRVRHYWSSGVYEYHADLDDQGILHRNDSITQNTNFNFNAFNIDLVFSWQIAPGSFLNVVYKNSLLNDKNLVIRSYVKNLNSAFEDSPLNVITLKFIYFFDVASVKRNRN